MVEKETEKKISQLQMMEQSMQSFLLQKQQFQAQLIEVESAFRPYVVSHAGAYGLMQVNYKVWKNEYNIDYSKICDIEYNVELGIKILKRYMKKSNGNILRALHLYNNGYLHNNHKYKYKVLATNFVKDQNLAKNNQNLL